MVPVTAMPNSSLELPPAGVQAPNIEWRRSVTDELVPEALADCAVRATRLIPEPLPCMASIGEGLIAELPGVVPVAAGDRIAESLARDLGPGHERRKSHDEKSDESE